VNISFCSYLRQKWIDLCQTKIKLIIGPFTHIVEYISLVGVLCFVILVCYYLGGPHVAAATTPCTFLLTLLWLLMLILILQNM